mgnify:CR=1 FL=1
MDKKYYRAKELAEYLGVGESTIWKKEQGDPEFPRSRLIQGPPEVPGAAIPDMGKVLVNAPSYQE